VAVGNFREKPGDVGGDLGGKRTRVKRVQGTNVQERIGS